MRRTGPYIRRQVGAERDSSSRTLPEPEDPLMLWTILAILLVLWLLGLIGSVGGAFIHLLLVIAVIVLIVQLMSGRRVA